MENLESRGIVEIIFPGLEKSWKITKTPKVMEFLLGNAVSNIFSKIHPSTGFQLLLIAILCSPILHRNDTYLVLSSDCEQSTKIIGRYHSLYGHGIL
jgi:uncharacterized protein YbcI